MQGGEVTTVFGHGNAVLACGYSPDDAFIVSGSYDGTLKVWTPASSRKVSHSQ
jgi:WD40 repeat protein